VEKQTESRNMEKEQKGKQSLDKGEESCPTQEEEEG
jgi:hypothetical protein